MRAWFHRTVLSRPAAAFVVMGLAFLVFGLVTLDLVGWLRANARFLLDNGWAAVVDGGIRQLLELLADAYLAMVAYVVFKACERALVDWATRPPPAPAPEHETKNTP